MIKRASVIYSLLGGLGYMPPQKSYQKKVASAMWVDEDMPEYVFHVPWRVRYDQHSNVHDVRVCFSKTKGSRMATMRIMVRDRLHLRRGFDSIYAQVERVNMSKSGRTARVILSVDVCDIAD